MKRRKPSKKNSVLDGLAMCILAFLVLSTGFAVGRFTITPTNQNYPKGKIICKADGEKELSNFDVQGDVTTEDLARGLTTICGTRA